MSVSLIWEPTNQNKKNIFSSKLENFLRHAFLIENLDNLDIFVDEKDLKFLFGAKLSFEYLKPLNIGMAEELTADIGNLINLIQTNGKIRIYEIS